MKTLKRNSFKRHFSQQKMITINQCDLPLITKYDQLQDSSPYFKRNMLEPFKAKLQNFQSQSSETTSNDALSSQKSEQLTNNGFQKLSVDIETKCKFTECIDKMGSNEGKVKLKKRRTINFTLNTPSENLQLQKSIQTPSLQYIQNQPKNFRKSLTRKYSLNSLNQQNQSKLIILEQKKSNFHPKNNKKQKCKIADYFQFLKNQSELHDVELKRVSSYKGQQIYFEIQKGNNGQIVKQAMKKRWWWGERKSDMKQQANLLWSQLKNRRYLNEIKQRNMKIQQNRCRLQQIQQILQIQNNNIHNHFENNRYLGSKLSLYLTFKNYSNQNGIKINNLILPTFYVQKIMDFQWRQFTKSYFENLQLNKIDNWDIVINKKYWIIKQYDNNNNKINDKIFATYKQIKLFIQKQSKKGNKFLIQKYISKPFLYKKRKFDIKCFILIIKLKSKITAYIHKDGFISTAIEIFDIINLENQFIHFTNQSIQMKSDQFGQAEPGNKIDFLQFQRYLDMIYGKKYNFNDMAFTKIQKLMTQFMNANYTLLKNQYQGSCFELFQCQFVMDQNFQPCLIDIHTNPSLQTYCQVLEKIIPNVIEDTFRHTIDLMFPPPEQWPEDKHHLIPNKLKQTGFIKIFNEGEYKSYQVQVLGIDIKSDMKIYEDEVLNDDSGTEQRSRDSRQLRIFDD